MEGAEFFSIVQREEGRGRSRSGGKGRGTEEFGGRESLKRRFGWARYSREFNEIVGKN